MQSVMSTKRKAKTDTSSTSAVTAKQQRVASQTSSKNAGTLLQRGIVLLRSYLSTEQQQALAQQVTLLGQSAGGFYDCNNEKTKRMRMVRIYAIVHPLCSVSVVLKHYADTALVLEYRR
jgi:hypothetical protein